MDQAAIAQQTFELENNVVTLDPSTDAIFHYNDAEQRAALNDAPWRRDPHFFQRVRISSVALIKMVMHARSGGDFEIMGLMQGKVDVATRTFYVMDAFALPVQGTETRVNAANEANEFMVQYLESGRQVGRLENAIGWYHSHPGYGCWLSGIDVNTQMNNQAYTDPFLAIVIDPNRTISAGRVDIGAFRTFPEGYKPPSAAPSEYQSIPLNKIEDFGVHANSYYALQVEHFKSTLDTELLRLLWNKYWVSTLSQSPLIVNRSYAVGQVQDLAEKLSRAVQSTTSKGQTSQALANKENGAGKERERRPEKLMEEIKRREEDAPLAKAVRDGTKISAEAHHGLIAQALKDALFNGGGASAVAALPSFGDAPPPAAQPAPATPVAQPVEPMQPAQPAESTQSVEPAQPAEPAQHAEASADTPTS